VSVRSKRAGFAGVTKLRKTLRRLDPEITSGVREVVRRGANAILSDAKRNAESAKYGKLPGIRETGDMIDSMSIKYSPDGFTAVIGPSAEDIKNLANIKEKTLKSGGLTKVTLRKKDARWNAIKGYWAEFGTKGDPSRNIDPITPAPFMAPAFDVNKDWISKDARKATKKAIDDAVRMTTDD